MLIQEMSRYQRDALRDGTETESGCWYCNLLLSTKYELVLKKVIEDAGR